MTRESVQIISFYEFKDLSEVGELGQIRLDLRAALELFGIRGTIIIAAEGYNGMVCGAPDNIAKFVPCVEQVLQTRLSMKSSFHDSAPFRRLDVRIKPEIVTLRQPVDISLGRGTHVDPQEWNALVNDPRTVLLDARNSYEFQTGTFRGAINPNIIKFSDLPAFVERNLDPNKHDRVAMFCTGGIRCEKFAPYMKQLGFREVYQLEGGILRYLEETPPEASLWEGECFVFDERVSVDARLKKGSGPDHSQRLAGRKKAAYKVVE